MVGGFIGARHRLALCQGAGTFKSQRSRIRALTADPRQLRVLQRSAVQVDPKHCRERRQIMGGCTAGKTRWVGAIPLRRLSGRVGRRRRTYRWRSWLQRAGGFDRHRPVLAAHTPDQPAGELAHLASRASRQTCGTSPEWSAQRYRASEPDRAVAAGKRRHGWTRAVCELKLSFRRSWFMALLPNNRQCLDRLHPIHFIQCF